MSARHSHRWLAWLLPLLLLRAFIPVGFMVSWSDDGHLQLVLCSGTGPMVTQVQAAASDAEQHQLHGGSHFGQHDHARSMDTSVCPFAAASSAAALASLDAVVAFVATVSQEVVGFPGLDLAATPVLIDRIRGPPLV